MNIKQKIYLYYKTLGSLMDNLDELEDWQLKNLMNNFNKKSYKIQIELWKRKFQMGLVKDLFKK